ncbi:MAG: ZIP family metal transporter [Candidatus Burarchaeum sp.]|nr:ZIP family metal transporter [Candidatus Burarchaeum sp.]MDO8339582.1 ZIP family metal transporter [Candidatus Burarchaeum sp.]
MVLEQIIIATLIVSLMSFVGIVTLALKDRLLHSLLPLFVSFSAGTMLAAAFFDLIPESLAGASVRYTMEVLVLGIVMFFVIEKFLYWHHHHKHHHKGERGEMPFTYLNLIGDGVHNFVDGTIIAASFLTNSAVGITTTMAIMAHEIPQEVGDFSLLIYGGFTKQKALLFNFISALAALAGALLTFYVSELVPGLVGFLVPLAAGNFIYMACVDLVPEMHKEVEPKKSAMQLVAFVLGLVVIGSLITTLKA